MVAPFINRALPVRNGFTAAPGTAAGSVSG